MLCNNDTLQIEAIPSCLGTIRAGAIGTLNGTLLAKFYNVTTDRTHLINATSNGTGVVSIPISEELPVNCSYLLSVHLSSDTSFVTPQNVTVDGSTGTSLLLKIKEVYDEDGNNKAVTTAVLKLKA